MSVQSSYGDLSTPFAGMRIIRQSDRVRAMRNADAVSIQFGRGVKYGGDAGDDAGAKLPTAETSKIAGIVAFRQGYIKSGDAAQIDANGVKVDEILEVLEQGEIYAVCEDGCVPGDKLWIRGVAAGDPEFLGGLNSADDGTDMVDCTTWGEWKSTASAGGLARLYVNKP